MRGDKTFAYDLIVRYGPVSCRVALLLRSAEGKPPSTSFQHPHPSPPARSAKRVLRVFFLFAEGGCRVNLPCFASGRREERGGFPPGRVVVALQTRSSLGLVQERRSPFRRWLPCNRVGLITSGGFHFRWLPCSRVGLNHQWRISFSVACLPCSHAVATLQRCRSVHPAQRWRSGFDPPPRG